MYRVKKFSIQNIFFRKDGSRNYIVGVPKTYIWNDEDCLYYNEDSDEDWFDEVPSNGRKCISFKIGYNRRLLVKSLVYGYTKF